MGQHGRQYVLAGMNWGFTAVLSPKRGQKRHRNGYFTNWVILGQTVYKPGFVHTPKGAGDHSSGMPVTRHLLQPTRATIRKQIMRCSYLVLLPTGFTLPLPLPAVRCALTAPFHPYRLRGGLLSVALSLESPPPDVIRRRVSVEPGLSSLANKSDHPTIWPISGLRRTSARVKPDIGFGSA